MRVGRGRIAGGCDAVLTATPTVARSLIGNPDAPSPQARTRVVLVDARTQEDIVRQRLLRQVRSIAAGGEQPLVVVLHFSEASQLGWLQDAPCVLALEEECPVASTELMHPVVARLRFDRVAMRVAFLTEAAGEPRATDWVPLPPAFASTESRRARLPGAVGRLLRADAIALVVAVAWMIAMLVPAPWVALSPTGPAGVDEFVLVEPPSGQTTVDGELLVGRVSDRQVRWGELPYWFVRTCRDVDLHRIQPQLGGSRPDQVQDRGELLQLGRQNAIVAALDALGEPFQYGGSGVIVDQSHPRFGVDNGDVIVRSDTEPIETELDLWRVIQGARAGDRVSVTLDDGSTTYVALEPDPTIRSGFQIPRFITANAMLRHEAPVRTPPTRVVGDSNGLAVALQVFDALSERDVMQGRTIMATGAMRPTGIVTPVGGVRQKVIAAHRAGVDLIIVPERNLREAAAVLPEDSRAQIVAVASLAEAIARLDPTGEVGSS
jgi:Lon-like protease